MSNDSLPPSEKKGFPKGLKVFFSFIGILLLVYVVWMLIYNSAFLSQRCCGGNGCTSNTDKDSCTDPCKWQRPNCSNPYAPWCSNFGLTQGWLGCEDDSNGNGKKCIDNPDLISVADACSNAPSNFKCSTESVCGTQKDDIGESPCCVLSEGYRRFNRSPRREGYRRFNRSPRREGYRRVARR